MKDLHTSPLTDRSLRSLDQDPGRCGRSKSGEHGDPSRVTRLFDSLVFLIEPGVLSFFLGGE